jgi:undecaprenyl-diphosphatase
VAFTHWILLAVLQAFAEVLPIGAWAHFSWLNLWVGLPIGGPMTGDVPGLAMGVRLGLLLGTAVYFWRDIGEMVEGLIRFAKGKSHPGARLVLQVFVAALPSVAVAVAIDRFWGTAWESPALTAWCMIGVGFLMLFFDRTCMTVKRIEHAGFADTLLLGCMQALAFVPGVGRIAASIAMARLLGYERADAARFSFLIWMPILLGSCIWHAPELLAVKPFPTAQMIVGFVPAFLMTLALIAILMAWVHRRAFTPFAIYRMLIGLNLLIVVYDLI